MTFDREKAAGLLHDLSSGLMRYWTSRCLDHKTGVFSTIEDAGCIEEPKVNFFAIPVKTSSRHDEMALHRAKEDARSRMRSLRTLVIEAAPVLDHPSAFWDVEFTNELDDDVAASPMPPPDPKVILSIACLPITEADKFGRSQRLSSREVANRLGDISDALSVIPSPGDRIFDITGSHIPANSPEEALYIFDTMTQAGLMTDIGTKRPQISEVFDSLSIQIDMRHRFRHQIEPADAPVGE